MKKLHIIFTAAAILLASIGICANNLRLTTYYYATSSGAKCTMPITTSIPPECVSGGAQCFKAVIIDGELVTIYLSRRVDGGECQVVPHP
jgi:hypothetical protein